MGCGLLEFDRSLFFSDTEKGTRCAVPVPAYLISHPRGHVLFDTGLHCDAISDPAGRLGYMAKVFTVRPREGDEIVTRLAHMGLSPADIGWVVNSHLHFDHAGGNEFFSRSAVFVQRKEMEATRDAEAAKKNGFDPKDFDHPLEYRLVDGEHDIFGDGKLVIIPTYGHTPGHQSLRVRPAKGIDLVLTGDACYTRENLDRNILPRISWDESEMYRSLGVLRRLRDREGASLLYGHDAEQWGQIPHAPQPVV